jgi:homoserine O-succinyltransferase/O-acetyltransferase
MPLELDPHPSNPLPQAMLRGRGADTAIVVGLLNNMPDTALEATENQFAALLAAAAGPHQVRLRFSYLPEVPRAGAALERVERSYWPLSALLRQPLDALIVTGTEPRAPSLCDEPYWQRFGEVLHWAEQHTISTVWSCLAAHAAVQLLDGIMRQRLPEKRFGVYEHKIAPGHPLTAGLTAPLAMPHSRWNDLPLERLRQAGYQMLSWSEQTGADLFAKQRQSLFVFFQGHPEYERTTLFREYRRDVNRYLSGQQESYPPLPPRYLTTEAAQTLEQFKRRAMAQRDPALFSEFPASAADGALSGWQQAATRIYGNWLSHLASSKAACTGAVRSAQV